MTLSDETHEDGTPPWSPVLQDAVETLSAALEKFGPGIAVDWLEAFAKEVRAGKSDEDAAVCATWDCDL